MQRRTAWLRIASWAATAPAAKAWAAIGMEISLMAMAAPPQLPHLSGGHTRPCHVDRLLRFAMVDGGSLPQCILASVWLLLLVSSAILL